MAKTNYVELGDGTRIPILYEDRSVIAIDKPRGWMLVPYSWQNTNRNLQAALTSSVAAGQFWARSRNLKFIGNLHRLDAETTGILLLGRSRGALETYSDLFESRRMEKTYLVVVRGTPKQTAWTCQYKLAPDPAQIGKMIVHEGTGKDAETHFRVLQSASAYTLIEARPVTGRTHQIRMHLFADQLPVVGDQIYGAEANESEARKREEIHLGLRAVGLNYTDPFTRKPVRISAPADTFLRRFGFNATALTGKPSLP